MGIQTEIEFKLAIDPRDAGALRRIPILRSQTIDGPLRRKVSVVYFDAPDLRLKRQGLALRLRKVAGKWMQTLKTEGSALGGLHQRGEWEYGVPGATLDLSLFRATPLAEIKDADKLHESLKPVFSTDFWRTSWIVEIAPGQRVEVALDQGAILCGNSAEAISEVEIEVVEGSAATAFDLAFALLDHLSLRPSALSKAERGYRLLQSLPIAPRKAATIELDAGWSAQHALDAIVANCLVHLESNVAGALGSSDAEFIHQLRVALRRLRSALRIFKPAGQDHFTDELRAFTLVLGDARDWDVMLTETLPPLLAGYADPAVTTRVLAAAKRQRRRFRKAAQALLASPRYARLVIELARWLSFPADAAPAPSPASDVSNRIDEGTVGSLSEFASGEIRRRHKRMLHDALALASLDAAARHRVRIDAKRLRYAVDFFASLFKKRRTGQYLSALSAIQDALGRANDAVTAERLLVSLSVPEAFFLFARGWLAARIQAEIAKVDKHFAVLKTTKRFWLKGPRDEVRAAVEEAEGKPPNPDP
jgi:triphosphatase